PRRHPDVEQEAVLQELEELAEHRVRGRHERGVDEAARAKRVPEGEQRQPRRRDQRGPRRGSARLRLQWGKRTMNHPFIPSAVLAPLVVGRAHASPEAAFAELTAKTAVLALQSGEPGPIAQAIAGVDIALHDLAARRRGRPLWRHLARGEDAGPGAASVPVYA